MFSQREALGLCKNTSLEIKEGAGKTGCQLAPAARVHW
jgi:hypothetical protein